ncbi:hypothetical protein AB6A40_001319 [Gnathostoma spinigerum]|uniref:Uncharacterized protein n=1 Tax=Gnathostoma spinigerum TaxID=75299 RepID=A0ABD6EE63_9BILA
MTTEELLKLDYNRQNQYIFYVGRLASFTRTWPHRNNPNLSPEKMAEAGFYFNADFSHGDNVKCAFCFKELWDWQDNDDPIEEHRKRKPTCIFTQLDKAETEYTIGDFLRLVAANRLHIMLERASLDVADMRILKAKATKTLKYLAK